MRIHLKNGTVIVADMITFKMHRLEWEYWNEGKSGHLLMSDIDYIIDAQSEDNLRQQG